MMIDYKDINKVFLFYFFFYIFPLNLRFGHHKYKLIVVWK